MKGDKRRLKYIKKNFTSFKNTKTLITGASSGLGLELSKTILELGGYCTFMVRNPKKMMDKLKEFPFEVKEDSYDILVYDQSDIESIKNAVDKTNKKYDYVVLNAGIYFPKKGSIASDNSSLTFKTNVVGTYALYKYIKNKMDTRFLFTGSIYRKKPGKTGYKPFIKSGFYPKRAKEYAISKRCIFLLQTYARCIDKKQAYVNHPGITSTNIYGEFAPFIKKIAQKVLYLITDGANITSLTILKGFTSIRENEYFVPRGLFHIAGLPKNVKPLFNEKNVKEAEELVRILEENYEI